MECSLAELLPRRRAVLPDVRPCPVAFDTTVLLFVPVIPHASVAFNEDEVTAAEGGTAAAIVEDEWVMLPAESSSSSFS